MLGCLWHDMTISLISPQHPFTLVTFFFKAWRSPAESIAPKRPDHGRSVHGEPKFTEESEYCTQFQTQGAENTAHMHQGPGRGQSAQKVCRGKLSAMGWVH